MAGSYKFALLRLSPSDGRQETLNIGICVFSDTRLDVHFSKGLEKIRAISRSLDPNEICGITESMISLDKSLLDSGVTSFDDRLSVLGDMGAIKLAFDGTFVAYNENAYLSRVSALLKRYVDPEIGFRPLREKRSKVLSDVKRIFKSERVLAKKYEDLSSHRIVPSVEIDEGLIADLVLKNGSMHVTEIVDASDDANLRSIISNVGVSTLVIERARMTFSDASIKSNIVYSTTPALEKSIRPALDAAEHLGVNLVNWRSESDRVQFVRGLASLAIPYEDRPKRKSVPIVGGHMRFH